MKTTYAEASAVRKHKLKLNINYKIMLEDVRKEKPKSPKLEEFKEFLKSRGEEDDHLYGRLIGYWENKGEEQARWFCKNDADKFDNEKVKLFIEKVLFDAGEAGLAKYTPWNFYRRHKAGLPALYDYE